MISILLTTITLTLSPQSLAQADPDETRSDLRVSGLKYPNSKGEGRGPVWSDATILRRVQDHTGFTDLLEYVLPSPDQEEAGSCLYMSLTGIAEWWLARLNPRLSRGPDGPVDLSERFLMNLAGIHEAGNGVANWKTDSMFLYNNARRGVLNSAYRFTKGWFLRTPSGAYLRAEAGAEGATYDTTYNWIDELSTITGGLTGGNVPLPRFERTTLFSDPESNQWNVGVAPKDVTDMVMRALTENRAPVHVIYNHMGYWHAVFIIGFDSNRDSEGCRFVERFRSFTKSEPKKLREQAARETDAKERQRLLGRATKLEDTSRKIETAYRDGGGCHPKGMFYVRDSIYSDPSEPLYDYDPSRQGDEAHYSKRIILREFDWLRYMANHVVQIQAIRP